MPRNRIAFKKLRTEIFPPFTIFSLRSSVRSAWTCERIKFMDWKLSLVIYSICKLTVNNRFGLHSTSSFLEVSTRSGPKANDYRRLRKRRMPSYRVIIHRLPTRACVIMKHKRRGYTMSCSMGARRSNMKDRCYIQYDGGMFSSDTLII